MKTTSLGEFQRRNKGKCLPLSTPYFKYINNFKFQNKTLPKVSYVIKTIVLAQVVFTKGEVINFSAIYNDKK